LENSSVFFYEILFDNFPQVYRASELLEIFLAFWQKQKIAAVRASKILERKQEFFTESRKKRCLENAKSFVEYF
jgi:hypothetical protein